MSCAAFARNDCNRMRGHKNQIAPARAETHPQRIPSRAQCDDSRNDMDKNLAPLQFEFVDSHLYGRTWCTPFSFRFVSKRSAETRTSVWLQS